MPTRRSTATSSSCCAPAEPARRSRRGLRAAGELRLPRTHDRPLRPALELLAEPGPRRRAGGQDGDDGGRATGRLRPRNLGSAIRILEARPDRVTLGAPTPRREASGRETDQRSEFSRPRPDRVTLERRRRVARRPSGDVPAIGGVGLPGYRSSTIARYTRSLNSSRNPPPRDGDTAAMITVIRPCSGSIENRVPDEPSHQYSPSPTGNE